MIGFKQRYIPWATIVLVCALSSSMAFAQALPRTSKKPTRGSSAKAAGLGEGKGFALSEDGTSRLHLRLDSGIGFDSNPYSLNFKNNFPTGGNGKFNSDFMGRIRPGLELDMPGNVFALTIDSSMDMGGYLGAFNPGLLDWGGEQGTRQFNLVKLNTTADLEINRSGMFSFALGDSLNFSRNPQALSFALSNLVSNSLRIGGGFRPGGGALSIKGDAAFDMALYVPCDVEFLGCGANGARDSSNPDFNSAALRANLRADYKFLPRTGIFAELSAGAHGYINTVISNSVQPYTVPLHLRMGAMGQFTSTLSVLASFGYDLPLIFDKTFNLGLVSAFNNGVNASNIGQVTAFNAQLEARWRVSHAIQFAGGFRRTLTPTPVFQYRIPNKLYLTYRQSIGTFLTVNAHAEVAFTQYGADVNAGTSAAAVDSASQNGFFSLTPKVKLGIAYHLTDWMSIAINNQLLYQASLGMRSQASDGTLTETDYLRNETIVMLSIHY